MSEEKEAICCLGVHHLCLLNVNNGYCLASRCQYRVFGRNVVPKQSETLTQTEPLPAHPGCCDICDTGGCCKEESEEA